MNQLTGGSDQNMIPDKCEALFDIRTVPGIDHKECVRMITQKLET